MFVGVGIATLAGCTAAPAPTHNWSARMSALLSDPNGQGGAGGDLGVDSGTKSAHGSVELAGVPSGKYDVLAVCTGTGTVHIAIRTPASPSRVLAASDVACGATLRLPVTVATKGIILEATHTGTSAQWQAAIATPGWEPTPTTYPH
jgi:phage tail sheath gpL-like